MIPYSKNIENQILTMTANCQLPTADCQLPTANCPELRYERKYRIEHASLSEVRTTLRAVPLSFQTSYPDRHINSLYLDTVSSHALADNLAGISERFKFRIRWYGTNLEKATKPVLEQKIKKNQLGAKKRFPLPDFEFTEGFDFSRFLQTNTHVSPNLQAVVVVQYLRSYFVSFDQKIRATIDSQLRFFAIQGSRPLKNAFIEDPAIVLEIKYDEKYDGDLDLVFQNLPYRVSKNSKYVGAMLRHYY
jgi:VTC domain